MNKDYKIICEEIENNNIILEDVISEGLIDNLKNMGKNTLAGITNAANAMTEKFISGIATIFGKPKVDGSINKIDTDALSKKLSNNNIIQKLFGEKINDIINSCKSISKDDLMSVMDEKKIEQTVEQLPDKNGNQPVTESIFLNYDNLFIICEDDNQKNIDISQYSIDIDPSNSNNPIKIKDKSGKEVTDKDQLQQITKQLLDKSSDTSKKPAEVNDPNEIKEDASVNSMSAASWVVDRGTKVLDIIQFPYNSEKLKTYIAKKIDSLNFLKDGKLKSKGALFGVTLRWIGLIILIFMIATYAAAGGIIAVGAYMGARLGRKAAAKIAMYGGKKYAEGVVSNADKAAKTGYENIHTLSKEDYIKRFAYAGIKDNLKKVLLRYSPAIVDGQLVFLDSQKKENIDQGKFKQFSILLDGYLLFYKNMSGRQGKYFNSNADSDKKFEQAYQKLKQIDDSI